MCRRLRIESSFRKLDMKVQCRPQSGKNTMCAHDIPLEQLVLYPLGTLGLAEGLFSLRHGLECLQVNAPESGKLLKQFPDSNFVQTHLRRVMINGGVPLEQAFPVYFFQHRIIGGKIFDNGLAASVVLQSGNKLPEA